MSQKIKQKCPACKKQTIFRGVKGYNGLYACSRCGVVSVRQLGKYEVIGH